MSKDTKVLILGNKPYTNFKLDDILDSFDVIYRFNLARPGENNGTKFGKLAMCGHIYPNFVGSPVSKERIIEIYSSEYELSYLTEWYDFFQANKNNFDEVFHQNEYNWREWNKMLESYGSPHKFSRMASTGYSTIFRSLLEGNKEIFVAGFTLCADELRESVGDSEGIAVKRNDGQSCHSFTDESRILAWLHHNEIVDASLCMIEDTKELTLKPNIYNTEPSEYILDLLK